MKIIYDIINEQGMMFMKLKWDEVYDLFDGAAIWENGHDMYWYRLMWGLMDYRGMNVYHTEYDLKCVLARAFAIINIYREFINICFDDDEIIEAFSSEDYSLAVMKLFYDDDDVRDVFAALNEELGLVRTFYSMFITCIEFKDGKVSYREDDSDEEDICDEEEYDEYYEFYDEDEEYDDYFCDEDEEEDVPEDCSEDYYNSFESYLQVLATSSMSIINDSSPEKVAGYVYLSRNMDR